MKHVSYCLVWRSLTKRWISSCSDHCSVVPRGGRNSTSLASSSQQTLCLFRHRQGYPKRSRRKCPLTIILSHFDNDKRMIFEIVKVDVQKGRDPVWKYSCKETSYVGRLPYSRRGLCGGEAAFEDQCGEGPFILTANFRGSKPSRPLDSGAVH